MSENVHKLEMMAHTLRQSVFGSQLKADDIQEFLQICKLKSYPKNTYLFRQEDPANAFFIIHTGGVKVHKILADGREQVIHLFRATDSLGEIALSGTDVFPISAVAIEDSQAMMIESKQLQVLIKKRPEISLHIIASMSIHLKFLVERLEQQKFQQSDVRLAGWLVAQVADGKDSFQLGIKKKMLASQLGISSETLSRTLLKFKKNRWINEDSQQIHLLDADALRKISQKGM